MRGCFNPRPTSWLGAAGWEYRVTVSILTQPIGWVQRHTGGGIAGACPGFNPHPTSRPGAALSFSLIRFQSSPNLSVGCSERWCAVRGALEHVSILTQSLVWVQSPDSPVEQSLTFYCFNPHPTSQLGAVDVEDLLVSDIPVFQSSPNREVGWSLHCQVQPVARIDSFQSSPNLSAGCSLHCQVRPSVG